MNSNEQKRGNHLAAQNGGLGRAAKYSHEQLSDWSSLGGKALLERRGREYFRELGKRQKRRSPNFRQMSPRVVAARINGKRGGQRRAQLHGPDERSQWSRLGGLAVKARFGSEHFRKLREPRMRKEAERMQFLQAQFDQRFPPHVRQRFDQLLDEVDRLF